MESIYIDDYEYYLNRIENDRYELISNLKNPYHGRIIEIIMKPNEPLKLKLKDFNNGHLDYILYLKKDIDIKTSFYSKNKEGLMANDREQPPIFYLHLTSSFDEEMNEKDIKLELRRDGKKTIKMVAPKRNYTFFDAYDGDEFRVVSRGIYEFFSLTRGLPYSLNRIKEYLTKSKQMTNKM